MEEYKKVTISFTKEQLEKLNEIMAKEQGYSRSSLVREAVDNYIGYRVQKENISYLRRSSVRLSSWCSVGLKKTLAKCCSNLRLR